MRWLGSDIDLRRRSRLLRVVALSSISTAPSHQSRLIHINDLSPPFYLCFVFLLTYLFFGFITSCCISLLYVIKIPNDFLSLHLSTSHFCRSLHRLYLIDFYALSEIASYERCVHSSLFLSGSSNHFLANIKITVPNNFCWLYGWIFVRIHFEISDIAIRKIGRSSRSVQVFYIEFFFHSFTISAACDLDIPVICAISGQLLPSAFFFNYRDTFFSSSPTSLSSYFIDWNYG
jgi:hypothetical protein